jgi:hypothetical protein
MDSREAAITSQVGTVHPLAGMTTYALDQSDTVKTVSDLV